MPAYLPRYTERLVKEALYDTRVVIVNGARQAGKSTLVTRILRHHPGAVLHRLDRADERASAQRDPDRFVAHDGLVAIDEVQRVPDLVLAVKARVDDRPLPGSFLLTGSARLLGLRQLPDALVGRSETVELWPFAQCEMERTLPSFVDEIFSGALTFSGVGAETVEGYFARVSRGGFPEAVERTERRRARFFESYLADLIDRDVIQLAEIQRRDQLHRLIELLSARAAAPLVIDQVAGELRVPAATVERYVGLLEEVFLIKRLPAWSASTTARAVRQRKLVFVDSGIAAHVRGLSLARLVRQEAAGGGLLENFVLSELARLCAFSDERVTLRHYRTRDGIEVDAVLETADGRVVGVEVKSTTSVRDDDFRGVRELQRRVPDRFVAGFVMHCGKSVLPFGPNLTAIPIDALWSGPLVP